MLEAAKKVKPKKYSEKARIIFIHLAFMNNKFENIYLNNSTETKNHLADFGRKHNALLYPRILNTAYNEFKDKNGKLNLKINIETYDQAVELYQAIFKEPPKITKY